MSFDDIPPPSWKAIGASSSLALIILSIYDIVASGWVLTDSMGHFGWVHYMADDYPTHFGILRYAWIVTAILLLILHIIVFHGYATENSGLVGKCKVPTIIALIVLLVLDISCLSVIFDHDDVFLVNMSSDLMLMSIAFLATLPVEAVLTLVLVVTSDK